MAAMVNCDICQDTGLEPIFEHLSFPAHSPAQKQVRLEPFEFERWPRQWVEGDITHQVLESFMICDCAAGQRRKTAAEERQQSKGSNGHGWQPRQATKGAGMQV